MALIGNRSVLLKSPGRFLSGAVASTERSNFSTAGQLASRFQAMDYLSGGIPAGHLAPSSWALPRTGGGMSSRSEAAITLQASGSGALGRGIAGEALISIDASAIGQLIAGAVGTATISLEATGSITATISTTGNATIVISASADPGALGWLSGAGQIEIDGSLVSYAIGHMVGTTEDTSTLTPSAIAAAVWSALAATYNVAGTMGARLNSAASGGVDYLAMAEAVRTELAAELARLDAAISSRQASGAVVDADVRYVNGVEIGGTGTPGDTWGPA